jgi:hypothetical protein
VTTNNNSVTQREAWLTKAAEGIRGAWSVQGVTVPADVKVTCGFPGGGSPRRRIGECWPRARSAAQLNEVFISPTLDDTLLVLDVLGHELLHAVDDCASGHGAAFSKNSRRVGYSGGKQSAVATEQARALVERLAKALGPYPHARVVLTAKKRNASSGLHKVECGCGNCAYMTAKKLEEFGFPSCGTCGDEMVVKEERGEKKVVTTV